MVPCLFREGYGLKTEINNAKQDSLQDPHGAHNMAYMALIMGTDALIEGRAMSLGSL